MFSDHHRDHGFHYSLEYSSDWNLELRDIRPPPPPEINSKLASSHILYDQIYVWKKSVLVTQSCLTLYDPMDHSPPGSSLCPWNSPGKNTGVSCHSLFQGIFLNWELNLGLLHCWRILYHLSNQGSPSYVENQDYYLDKRSPRYWKAEILKEFLGVFFCFSLKWFMWVPWFSISSLYRPRLGCWEVFHAPSPQTPEPHEGNSRNRKKGIYSAFCVPKLPSPSPLCGDCPSLVQSLSFPFLQNQLFLGQMPRLETTCCFHEPRKKAFLHPSSGTSMEPAVSGGPRARQRWPMECLLTMLLGILILWRDCSLPTGYCYQGASWGTWSSEWKRLTGVTQAMWWKIQPRVIMSLGQGWSSF